MKIKSILAASVLALTTCTVAYAGDNPLRTESKDGFYAGISLGQFAVHGSEEASGSAFAGGINGGYRHYFNDRLSVDGNVTFIAANSGSSDKFIIPTVSLGYDFPLSNGMVIRPKVGAGMHFDSFTDGSYSNYVVKTGVDLDISKHVTVGVDYNFMKGKQNNGSLVLLNASYKF
ncbi:porin family protein [Ralstonia insidiosa]|uniref:porin family protein n=1 Tax=Ralstonia insidiosa TaxID=190721 RepID=UPI0009EE97B8|nr:porin family protein [Ralstonia insidiosa]